MTESRNPSKINPVLKMGKNIFNINFEYHCIFKFRRIPMLKKYFKSLFTVLALITAVILLYSCTASPASSVSSSGNNLKLKLKCYMGSASVGDFVSYTLDYTSNNIIFSNMTHKYTWSASFASAGDGSYQFSMPFGFGSMNAYFLDVPDKALAVTFEISTNDGGTNNFAKALAILSPNTITSSNDMTNMNGLYFQIFAQRFLTNNYINGLYSVRPMVVTLQYPGSNDIYLFNETSTNIDLVYQTFHGSLWFSNNTPYGTGPDGPVPAMANGVSYVADLGANKGFDFGCLLRNTSITASDYTGKYSFMYLVQSRASGNSTLDVNDIVKGYFYMSNQTGNLIDAYMVTNGQTGNGYIGTLEATNLAVPAPASTTVYFAKVTNNNYGNIVIALSKDLQMALITSYYGDSSDTNNVYNVMYGFAVRNTNN
jgi:hypothetical protein